MELKSAEVFLRLSRLFLFEVSGALQADLESQHEMDLNAEVP
jgi:hypothetical protein